MAEVPAGTIQMAPERMTWSAAPGLPPGASAAVLEGDPRKAGLFTMRLRVPAGTRLAPHWHPRDERVTVLTGTAMVGFGRVFDEKSGARFPAGSFYLNPAGSHHYVWFPEDSEVQVTALGPWELHYLEPEAGPASGASAARSSPARADAAPAR